MKCLIIHKPHLLTRLDIWAPRYSDKHGDVAEWIVLLAQYKVNFSSPIVLVRFTKARHLMGQRFCIKREDVQRCTLDTNGKIPMYAVPLSQFMTWETAAEAAEIAETIFDN